MTNDKGKLYAQEIVRVDYQAPDRKDFRTISEEGSGLVRDLVLKRLIESESETSSGRAHHDSAIKPANYEFNLLGEQDVGPYHCLVAEATPKRKDKYLFEGKGLDRRSGLRHREDRRPAGQITLVLDHSRRLRAAVRKDWRLLAAGPGRDIVHMRLNGKKMLTIHHRDYVRERGRGRQRPRPYAAEDSGRARQGRTCSRHSPDHKNSPRCS